MACVLCPSALLPLPVWFPAAAAEPPSSMSESTTPSSGHFHLHPCAAQAGQISVACHHLFVCLYLRGSSSQGRPLSLVCPSFAVLRLNLHFTTPAAHALFSRLSLPPSVRIHPHTVTQTKRRTHAHQRTGRQAGCGCCLLQITGYTRGLSAVLAVWCCAAPIHVFTLYASPSQQARQHNEQRCISNATHSLATTSPNRSPPTLSLQYIHCHQPHMRVRMHNRIGKIKQSHSGRPRRK